MTILTTEQVAAIRERAEKATPGPWEVGLDMWHESEVMVCVNDAKVSMLYLAGTGRKLKDDEALDSDVYAEVKAGQEWMDGVFIASSRSDVPALCDTVDAERKENAELRERLRVAEEALKICRISGSDAEIISVSSAALARIREGRGDCNEL